MAPPLKLSSRNRRIALILGIVAIFGLFAGCSSSDPGQTGPVTVYLTNDGNATHEFSVATVDGELGQNAVVINRRNKSVDYASAGQGLGKHTYSRDYGYVTSLELPANRTEAVGTYTLNPNETVQTNATEFDTGDTLVIVNRREDRIVTMITANCNEASLNFVSVTASPNDTFAGYFCG
ncbi:hypothetical protein NDI54_14110 [Haloarcula sp. S1AR25-5A]|uniref:Uncharacterized protein n=1 Tax=Haloarcula terrestris TaxID=2950533 RepID=A0AAE4EYC9_9EURY|nr:hypothetical protein [Haloarcula terrestris]MDS0222476.1 hypothetical protein [Haloarcula terrestris]